jgi:hypothetical protein
MVSVNEGEVPLPKFASVEVKVAVILCAPGAENETLQGGTTPALDMGFVHSVVVMPASVSLKSTEPEDGRAEPLGVVASVAVKTTTSLTFAVGDEDERATCVEAEFTTWWKTAEAGAALKFTSPA